MIKINPTQAITAVLLLMATYLGSMAQTGKSKCELPSADQTTIWGKQNIILKEADIFTSIHGKAVASGKPLAGVLVEVYDNPEGLLLSAELRGAMRPKQRRVAACVTGADGTFAFPNTLAGNYELRLSKPAEWDSTSVFIVVNPIHERRTKKKLAVQMHLSQ